MAVKGSVISLKWKASSYPDRLTKQTNSRVEQNEFTKLHGGVNEEDD